jgi:alkyl sulfatase BDS1-like metallo-beta-lactamase superfamily hydrolase
LISAPGETDDQLFVWLPEQKVLISADNYYKSFPTCMLSGEHPIEILGSGWKTIDKMIDLNAQYLLPGHSRTIIGQENIRETLTNYRNAIDFVLQETLKFINQGLTPDELVTAVNYPPIWRKKPYLQEFYGTVQWSVRSIFTGYLGWFDGNPTNLNPLAPKTEAEHMAKLAGGSEFYIMKLKKLLYGKIFSGQCN